MNKAHLEFCSSPEWARLVEDELLPWVLDGYQLGDDLLEVGPGPGLTTDVLRRKAARVTAVDLDLDLAGKLASRLAGSNVTVVAGDVTRLPFPAGRFSCAACLTMLHHIPSPAQQDAALAELARVLNPGGSLLGSDGLDTPARREIHEGDIFVPVDPGTLEARLRGAGFTRARVAVMGDRLKFAATKDNGLADRVDEPADLRRARRRVRLTRPGAGRGARRPGQRGHPSPSPPRSRTRIRYPVPRSSVQSLPNAKPGNPDQFWSHGGQAPPSSRPVAIRRPLYPRSPHLSLGKRPPLACPILVDGPLYQ